MPYLGVRAGSVIVIYPGDDDDDDVWESPSFLESRGEMYDSEDDDKDDDEECASSGPGGSKPKQPAPHSKKPSFRKPAAQRGGWKKVRDAADFEEENWLLFRRNAVQETSRNWVFKYSKTLRNGSKTAVYKCGDDNCDAELKVTEGCAPDKGIIEQKDAASAPAFDAAPDASAVAAPVDAARSTITTPARARCALARCARALARCVQPEAPERHHLRWGGHQANHPVACAVCF